MPVSAIVTCIVIGWLAKPGFLIKEVKLSTKFRGSKVWVIMIKYVCPFFILAILISNLIAAFA